MPATRPRLTGLTIPVLALLASLASGTIACESTPMDMYITKDPDAGADFQPPPRDVGERDAGDETGGAGGTGGTGGGGGSSGAAGDTGSGTAGTTGSGGGGTGGDTGSGGGAGTGGAGGNN